MATMSLTFLEEFTMKKRPKYIKFLPKESYPFFTFLLSFISIGSATLLFGAMVGFNTIGLINLAKQIFHVFFTSWEVEALIGMGILAAILTIHRLGYELLQSIKYSYHHGRKIDEQYYCFRTLKINYIELAKDNTKKITALLATVNKQLFEANKELNFILISHAERKDPSHKGKGKTSLIYKNLYDELKFFKKSLKSQPNYFNIPEAITQEQYSTTDIPLFNKSVKSNKEGYEKQTEQINRLFREMEDSPMFEQLPLLEYLLEITQEYLDKYKNGRFFDKKDTKKVEALLAQSTRRYNQFLTNKNMFLFLLKAKIKRLEDKINRQPGVESEPATSSSPQFILKTGKE
jgi:hypothetical protein